MKKPFFLLGYKDDQYTYTSIGSVIGIILIVLFAFAMIAVWPFICIWSLNTLFNLDITYSLNTWLAGLVLLVTFKTIFTVSKQKNE